MLTCAALGPAAAQVLSRAYTADAASLGTGAPIIPGAILGRPAPGWLMHARLHARGAVIRASYVSEQASTFRPDGSREFRYSGDGWRSEAVADAAGGWRVGLAAETAAGRARWYGQGAQVSTGAAAGSSLALSAGRRWNGGWYASVGAEWASGGLDARAAGLDLTLTGLPRSCVLDVGRTSGSRTSGVRTDLATCTGMAAGRVAGVWARSPWGAASPRVAAYTYRRSATGARGVLAWYGGLDGPNVDLLDAARFDHGSLGLTGSASAVIAFTQQRRGRTTVFAEVAAGWLQASLAGDAEAVPGIPELGTYTATVRARSPWAHVAVSGGREFSRHWSVGAGLRLDAVWPKGEATVRESANGLERDAYAERLTGGLSYSVAPTLGVTFTTGSLEAAYGVAWPAPVWRSTEAPAAVARRPIRLPALQVLSVSYLF